MGTGISGGATARERLLTVSELSEILQVPVSWVYDHVRPSCQNPLPHIKIGKYVRFRHCDILTYIETAAHRCGR